MKKLRYDYGAKLTDNQFHELVRAVQLKGTYFYAILSAVYYDDEHPPTPNEVIAYCDRGSYIETLAIGVDSDAPKN